MIVFSTVINQLHEGDLGTVLSNLLYTLLAAFKLLPATFKQVYSSVAQ